VEKDYWIMHCLWGLQQQGFKFELKGGTSLSKAFHIIDRFSEDIDIQIHPEETEDVKTGKNHDKTSHIESRKSFFENICKRLIIEGLQFKRDTNFDDTQKMRGAGIRAEYLSHFSSILGLKEGIVLELGFDQTNPNLKVDISSWAFDRALSMDIDIIDNRSKNVICYCPEYTFVEKLQAISTKFRLQQQNKIMPVNFLRHYYDVYKLLENERVQKFIGSNEYNIHKNLRFRKEDETNIKDNPAFTIPDTNTRKLYSDEFKDKSAIYFGIQPEFEEILTRIKENLDCL
jgi:predicted nucleotidyltransferase component of viral defense system